MDCILFYHRLVSVTQDYLLSWIEHGFKSHDQDCGLPLQKLFFWGAEGVLMLSCCSLEACSFSLEKRKKGWILVVFLLLWAY